MLGPEPDARQRIDEFRAELMRTRADFPGIEQRTAMLEKCSPEIEERLAPKFQQIRADGPELLGKLMFGDSSLAPHLLLPEDEVLGLVSAPVVREGAAVLQRLYADELFPPSTDWEEWCRDNYKRWRQLYLEAAEHAEEVLVGVS